MSNKCDTCIFVLFLGTENAMKGVKEFGATRMLNSVKAYSASDTALAIIKAGTQRLQRFYFPHTATRFVTVLYTFFPEYISRVFRYIWRPEE